MDDDERAASAVAEPLPEAAGATAPSVGGDVAMEDATPATAASGDAVEQRDQEEKEEEESEVVNVETASVASDATVDLEQMEVEDDVEVEEMAAVDTAAASEEEQMETAQDPPTVASTPTAIEDAADNATVTPEVAPAAEENATMVENSAESTTQEPPATGSTDAAMEDVGAAKENSSSSSSSSDSSSSSESSSSSSDSSDSEVEDVTDQYKKPEDANAPRLRTMSESGDDEVDAEQWFDEPTLEEDGVEVVGVVEATPQDGAMGVVEDDEEEDVFLMPFKPELERGSATKRRRPEGEHDAMENGRSAGEETTSSEPDMLSDDEFGRRHKAAKATRRKKSRKPASESHTRKPTKQVIQRPPKAPQFLATPLVFKSVPAKYDIFNGVPNDDSNFPFLKGDYHVRDGHRAYFTGLWGFTDADFKKGGFTSKFEYTSGYLHGRRDSDKRPFSGAYGGYFNLRQFSGKITKIKEDHIQLCFVRLRGDDENKSDRNLPSDHDDDDDDDDDDGVDAQYEVFGEGKNRFGRFLVRGYFSATTSRMTVRRHYLD